MDWPGIPATLGVCRPYLGVGGSRFGAILPFYTLGKSSLYSLYQDHIGAVEMELRLTLWAEELIYPPAGCEVFWCYQTWNIQRCFLLGLPLFYGFCYNTKCTICCCFNPPYFGGELLNVLIQVWWFQNLMYHSFHPCLSTCTHNQFIQFIKCGRVFRKKMPYISTIGDLSSAAHKTSFSTPRWPGAPWRAGGRGTRRTSGHFPHHGGNLNPHALNWYSIDSISACMYVWLCM